MIELLLIGMATGNPEHLTLQAVDVLKRADLVLLPRKGDDKTDLADARRAICANFLERSDHVVEFDLPTRDATGTYLDGVADWHDAIAATWGRLIRQNRPKSGSVALLVWGDPSLYDSSLRIAERLTHEGIVANVTVVPGLTSLQLLTAAHAIPLNTVGAPVQLTTGRRLRDEGWPAGVDSVAVFLDGGTAFDTLVPDGLYIYWGAYLGMPQEICRAGFVADIGQDIIEVRAAARAKHGWIMDVYLLRRMAEASTA